MGVLGASTRSSQLQLKDKLQRHSLSTFGTCIKEIFNLWVGSTQNSRVLLKISRVKQIKTVFNPSVCSLLERAGLRPATVYARSAKNGCPSRPSTSLLRRPKPVGSKIPAVHQTKRLLLRYEPLCQGQFLSSSLLLSVHTHKGRAESVIMKNLWFCVWTRSLRGTTRASW